MKKDQKVLSESSIGKFLILHRVRKSWRRNFLLAQQVLVLSFVDLVVAVFDLEVLVAFDLEGQSEQQEVDHEEHQMDEFVELFEEQQF